MIAGMRNGIDRLTALPRASRPDTLRAALTPIQQAYDVFSRVLMEIQAEPGVQDEIIQDDLDVSRLAYALRKWAARRGTLLIEAIASAMPMPPATIEQLAGAVGHIDEVWDQIQTYQRDEAACAGDPERHRRGAAAVFRGERPALRPRSGGRADRRGLPCLDHIPPGPRRRGVRSVPDP